MPLLQLFFSFLLLSCTCYVSAFDIANFQPAISQKVSNPQCNLRCSEALEMAKAMFFSKHPNFSCFCVAMPKKVNSRIVIQSGDNVNQDSLIVRDDLFKKIVKKEPKCSWCPESIYWQNKAEKGFRLVLDEDPIGWRGFMYRMFVIREAISVDAFLTALYKLDSYSGETPEYIKHNIVISNQWQPPLVLKDQNNLVWVIEFEGYGPAPYGWGGWKVFSIDHTGIQLCCSIDFWPKHKKIEELLPKEVNKLAKLLDKALGKDGKLSGTIRYISYIQASVSTHWANIALRPWVNVQPYNSRKEVDRGLKKWAEKSNFNHKIYQSILQQYKKAESSLARYYEEQLHMDKNAATNTAKNQLDVMFREYFIFQKRG